MKPEAKLILTFCVCLVLTLIFYREEPTSKEVLYQEARAAGVLLDTADL